MALNVVYRRTVKQVYVIHGSCEEAKDFGRIRYLNPLDITMVAVSDYVKQRLIEYGARADRIEVVRNFLLPEQIAAAPKRGPFTAGVTRALCATRLVEAKRFDVSAGCDRPPSGIGGFSDRTSPAPARSLRCSANRPR